MTPTKPNVAQAQVQYLNLTEMPHHHLSLLLHLTHLIFTALLLEHIHIVEDKNNHLIHNYTIVVRLIISNSGCPNEAVCVRVS